MIGVFSLTFGMVAAELFCGSRANVVEDVCGSQTSGVAVAIKRASKDSLKGAWMYPFPEFWLDANCKIRRIIKCGYESTTATPTKNHGLSEAFSLKIDGGSYECHLQCYDKKFPDLVCNSWPKGLCAGKAIGKVTGVEVHMREDDMALIPLLPLPNISYDADCGAERITKCCFGQHCAIPEENGGRSSPFQLKGRLGEAFECQLQCNAKVYAAFQRK